MSCLLHNLTYFHFKEYGGHLTEQEFATYVYFTKMTCFTDNGFFWFISNEAVGEVWNSQNIFLRHQGALLAVKLDLTELNLLKVRPLMTHLYTPWPTLSQS